MSTTTLIAVAATIGTVFGASLGSIVTGFFSSRNSRKDREQRELQAHEEREHRERMARLEDWRRQRDEATKLVRSLDPNDQKRGFAWLRTLENDSEVPQKDREFVQQIRELAVEAVLGKAYWQLGNKSLGDLEVNQPVKVEPGTATPASIAAADIVTRHMQQWHASGVAAAQWMTQEGIRLYGGLPPDQDPS
jgi:hypothetical protein